ncbi:hypothetical protein MRB53_038499 [Persea americana]|nr:hypothetical protein MRB53_038499 [Persea americana]
MSESLKSRECLGSRSLHDKDSAMVAMKSSWTSAGTASALTISTSTSQSLVPVRASCEDPWIQLLSFVLTTSVGAAEFRRSSRRAAGARLSSESRTHSSTDIQAVGKTRLRFARV